MRINSVLLIHDGLIR